MERTLLYLIRQIGRNAHRMENRGVQILNRYRMFHYLAGPFVRSLTVKKALLHATADQQHRPRIGEVPVHAVMLEFLDAVRDIENAQLNLRNALIKQKQTEDLYKKRTKTDLWNRQLQEVGVAESRNALSEAREKLVAVGEKPATKRMSMDTF